MPTLNWIGKEAVVKHHQDVPFRLLEPVPELSCGDGASGNLIVQGDNLHALKALLPRYAGSVQKADVTVAKNYLHEPEIGALNRIVTMWLDFAEDQARRRKEVFLKDWVERLDAFLKFNERNVLDGAGRMSRKQADAHAESEYEQFAAQRRALLEAEGAEFNVRTLEDAAKALPKPDKNGT